ncbi:MAG TPA: SDR family oxidoreductase [Streptosporangiaceae bacterium]|nr:SDR family oxidoreductase [Streptosporangiaceae bacterium]
MVRNVLITGASNGIGRAIAARFAAGGDTVVITGRNADRLRQAAADVGAQGVVCDAADLEQVTALRAGLAGRIGPALDILVNNAGGNTDFDRPADEAGTRSGEAGTGPDEAGTGPDAAGARRASLERLAARWQANLDANLLSAVLTTGAVADMLAPGGSVISIGTIGAERGGGSYGAAKAALAAWNADLSADIGPRGVTANVISAGYIAGTNFFRDRLTSQRRDTLVAATHDKRAGRPDDIAEAVYFLASPGARHITGQTIHVNGGAFTTR